MANEITYYDTPFTFISPVRHFKANDPYYYEVDNIPIKQLEESQKFLKDQVDGIISRQNNKNDIEIDRRGNVYITGYTVSSNFPLTPDAYSLILNGYDVFLVKLSSDGSTIVYSTLFGGSLTEYGECITLDPFGGVYVVGRVSSSDFPTTNDSYDSKYAGNWDAFIFKYSRGSQLCLDSQWLYFGGCIDRRSSDGPVLWNILNCLGCGAFLYICVDIGV